MRKTLLASLIIFVPVALAAGFNLPEFALNSGVVVGKAVGCKLDGPRIMKATKTAFATINVMGKTPKERDDATALFGKSMDLGEAYIKQNGNAHCKTIDQSLDVIINLGR